MSFRAILAAVSRGTTSDGVIEIACRLVRRFEAYLEALHIRREPRQVFAGAAGKGFAGFEPGETIDEFTADIAAIAANTKAACEAATGIGHRAKA